MSKQLLERWSVTAFSFTGELMARQVKPTELVSRIARQHLAKNLEVDGPQFFRNYPNVPAQEIEDLKKALQVNGLRLVVIGGYMDRFYSSTMKVSDEDAMGKLKSQLELASQLNCYGLRLQFDALRENEFDQAITWAEQYQVKILLELQGSATPEMPLIARTLEFLKQKNHPMLRVLLDASLLMRSFPTTYRRFLLTFGLRDEDVSTIENSWKELNTNDYRSWLVEKIKSGKFPHALMGQIPTLTARFGHTTANDWKNFSALFDCVHLKYWDSDDSHGALSDVAAEAFRLFDLNSFSGFIVSEWGGHDWLSLDEASGFEMSEHHKAAVEPIIKSFAEVG